MAQSLYVLFEHATGFSLFLVKEFDEMALLAPRVEQCVLDLGKFNSLVQTVAFRPFKNGQNGLDNLNCITEGIVHEDLKVFLEANVPKSSKKLKVYLGVGDSKLAAAIMEEMHINCETTGAVPELLRGIRLHFVNLIKDRRLNEDTASRARLGLGHNYSRTRVKFNVNRVDNMIIQSIALLDQLDKDINTFSMRIREWYSYHFPELVKIIPDNYMYARTVQLIKDRKQMPKDSAQLEEIIMDSAKTQAVLDAARVSMGMDISALDLINIQALCERVIGLSEFRQQLSQYLVTRMQAVAPNLAALIGDQVGARLIAHAGSLTNLAKCPASTVQILGAEKALFRALKTKGNTPKYGLIFHSTFIGRAGAQNKGRISRYLANKCSIASRIDCFADTPSNIFGDHLRQQVEDRLKFYETGDAPSKNIDIMRQAVAEFSEFQAKEAKRKKKEEKKKQKKNSEETSQAEPTMEISEVSSKKKKKKKHQQQENSEEATQAETTFEAQDSPEKKKKNRKRKLDESQADSTLNETSENVDVEGEPKGKQTSRLGSEADSGLNNTVDSVEGDREFKKKKKKRRSEPEGDTTLNDTMGSVDGEEEQKKEKKKKRRSESEGDTTLNDTMGSVDGEEEQKKKKKKKRRSEPESDTTRNDTMGSVDGEEEQKKEKKKKRRSEPEGDTTRNDTMGSVDGEEEQKKEKKKKRRSESEGDTTRNDTMGSVDGEKEKKKKRRSESEGDTTRNDTMESVDGEDEQEKKRKTEKQDCDESIIAEELPSKKEKKKKRRSKETAD